MSERITEIPKLPPRADDAHKGRFGRVLIVGGSRGMIGAPALTANAALRSGAGLVRIAVPESVQLTTAGLTPCAISIPLAEDEKGLISSRATHDILNAMDESDSLAFGPGLGQSNDLQLVVETIVKQYKKPLIIDADGLNNLTAIAGEDLQLTANTILTPHPGEMARLWRAWFREEQPGDRTEQAEKLSQRCGAVVVLKGAGTVVTDGERTYVNETGNPGMATGGSGDVLTGCIAALTANKEAGFDTLTAAISGVYIHGRAGDLAAAVLTETALTATDIIEFLSDAWGSVSV